MAVFYTSDLHIGHGFIAALRWDNIHNPGTSSMDSRLRIDPLITRWHDDLLAENWDTTVSDDDVIYVLGDLSAGGAAATGNALAWLQDRPGRKRLVYGNHDPGHPMHRDVHKWFDQYSDTFESHTTSLTRKIMVGDQNPVRVRMSHFPYDGDHFDNDRFEEDRLRDMGAPLLHGHTHVAEKLSTSINGTVQIHVGVDAWNLTPIPEAAIIDLLRA